jgi:glycine betaine/proline transport system ATP-binding protein
LGDLPNVQRIEVLNGPQSTLFGKNASAGVISVVTREPQFEFGGSAEAVYGNFNTVVLKADITGPISDNIAFALELRNVDAFTRGQVAEDVIERVSLQGYGNRYPSELSGGMQQRVGLARALAADPDILLMDEPFSALDPLIRRGLQDEFLELSRSMKKTTLFITHDLDEAIRMGTHIAIMKDGEIVQIGTPEDIVTKPADDYVADFVQGISKLKLIFAHTVMKPIEAYEQANGTLTIADCPQATPDDDLDRLVELAVDQPNPVVIMDAGNAVGVVTKDALLHGIQGEA